MIHQTLPYDPGLFLFSHAIALLRAIDGRVIVEIGGIRDLRPEAAQTDGHSTVAWSRAAECEVWSVDINPAVKVITRSLLDPTNRNVHCVTSDGLAFVQNFPGTIDLLYLDGPDPQDNGAIWTANLFEAALPRLSKRALLLVDDTDTREDGKGTFVIPLAQSKGFRILYKGRQTLLARDCPAVSNSPETVDELELTDDNAAALVERFIAERLHASVYPARRYHGRGIVMAAGGMKYQINAWVTIRMLRMSGCRLPIECWYLGPDEFSPMWSELVKPHDVICIDAHEVRNRIPHRHLRGWELKPYAIQHSRFAEVLFLDADNVPVRDPTCLFDSAEYRARGAIFWPDIGRLGYDRLAWRVFGNIPYRDEPEVESGQIVLDKARCWSALELCHWYMQHSPFYFRHVHGDKEVFHLAWRKLGLDYAMPVRGIDRLPNVLCQHDFEHRRLFQHRTMAKWSLQHNPRIPGFLFEDECLQFLEELKRLWAPIEEKLGGTVDEAAMAAMHQHTFAYQRVGYDQRLLTFDRNGTFLQGGAACETYWRISEGELKIYGKEGKLTMILTPHPDGKWKGRWLIHEKMPIELREETHLDH